MNRIVLIGGSGNVGRSIVTHLIALGVEPVVVSRRPAASHPGLSGIEVFGYDALPQAITGARLVVDLAVRNNDSPGSQADFDEVNVDRLTGLLDKLAAVSGRDRRFVALSTFQAMSHRITTPYAESKRRAESMLAKRDEQNILTLRIPAFKSETPRGRLRLAAGVPGFLRPAAMTVLAAARPSLSPAVLAQFLAEEAGRWPDRVTEVADDQSNNPVYAFGKRAVDVIFALGVIAALWWLLVAIWVFVRLDSPGPGIFAQERVGRNGHSFTCYKFRTMTVGSPQAGTHELRPGSITRLGNWLRRAKLDELPQVVNLLRNEVSLVGPRPCLPVQQELIDERRRRGVLAAKPGITGLAQINDIDMSTPRLLAQWDRRYLMTRSLTQEFSIILATFTGRGMGDRIGR